MRQQATLRADMKEAANCGGLIIAPAQQAFL